MALETKDLNRLSFRTLKLSIDSALNPVGIFTMWLNSGGDG